MNFVTPFLGGWALLSPTHFLVLSSTLLNQVRTTWDGKNPHYTHPHQSMSSKERQLSLQLPLEKQVGLRNAVALPMLAFAEGWDILPGRQQYPRRCVG